MTFQIMCTGCGTTDLDWIEPQDQGYSACCNEPTAHFDADRQKELQR